MWLFATGLGMILGIVFYLGLVVIAIIAISIVLMPILAVIGVGGGIAFGL